MKNSGSKGLRLSSLLAALSAFAMISMPFSPRASAASPPSAATPTYKGPVLVTMFDGKLDTRNAKVGDTVTLKVKKTLKLNDLEIPSGSKVIGRVQSVQSMEQGNGTAALSILFDKVQFKGNGDKVMPVRGLIVAIGHVSTGQGLGYSGVLGRGGVGSTPGLDPSLAAGNKIVDDVPPGSSLPGVALAEGLDAQQTSQLRGVKTDIKLDPSVMVKVELFRAAPSR